MNGCISFDIGPINIKLENVANLNVLFLTMWISCPGEGGRYSHTLPVRVCAVQRGCDFEAPGLERGIHFRGVF